MPSSSPNLLNKPEEGTFSTGRAGAGDAVAPPPFAKRL